MSASIEIREDRLVFPEDTDLKSQVQHRLKTRYGRGVFIQEHFESPNGEIVLKLGVAYPKDVSDRRERDNVIKYINIGDVETIYAEPTTDGYYMIDLPDRSDIMNSFHERREEMTDQLDWSMAKAIYNDVYQLDPVQNQLNSLFQIVRWLRKEGKLNVDRIDDLQRGNTMEYLGVLENLSFIRIDEDEMVRPGGKLEATDIVNIDDIDDYQKKVVGMIVRDGYHILKDQLDLRMLSHFPKYANSYYYTALQRRRADVSLDQQALLDNLKEEWNEDVDPLILDDKMNKLSEVGVLDWDGRYAEGEREVYQSMEDAATAVSVAD